MTENCIRDRVRLFTRQALAIGVIAACAAPQSALGFVEVAGGELMFEATARITSDSNILGDTTELDDTIYSLAPSLVFRRAGGRGTIDARVGTIFNRYSDFDAEDSNDVSGNVQVHLPTAQNARLTGDLNVSFFDGRQIDEYAGLRYDLKTYGLSADGNYRYSSKTSFRFGANVGVNRPEALTNPDNTFRSLRLGLGTQFRPRMSAFLDLRRSWSDSDPHPLTGDEIDHTDNAILLGFDGEYSPRINGRVSFGFQDSNADGPDTGGDAEQFVADVEVTWQFRPRSSLSVSLGSDSNLTNTAETLETVNVAATLNQEIGRSWNASLGVRWESYDVRGVADSDNTVLGANFDVSYTYSRNFSAGLSVYTFKRYAPIEAQDISRTTFSLFGTATF